MAKNKKRVNNTTKNTKKNVYKVRGEYVGMVDKLNSITKNLTAEDELLIQAKVLTQSNEKIFEHIIEMLQSGVLSDFINDVRVKLSNEFPVFKMDIMEREMFVVTMFLSMSLMRNDTETINEWSECFKRSPMEVVMKTLRFIEFVRNDSDLSMDLTKLDKVVDWNS